MKITHSMVSALVNAGFGSENLLSKKDSYWINRN